MLLSICRFTLGFLVLTALATTQVSAQGKPRLVVDEAKLFGAKAIDETNAIIAQLKSKYGKDLVIDTKQKGAPDLETSARQAAEYAELLAKSGQDGVYIIITTNPKHLQTQLIKKDKSFLTIQDRNELAKILRANLAKSPDDALVKVAQRVLALAEERVKLVKVDTKPRTVNDEAKVFGKAALDEVNETIAKIKKTHGKDLLIETVAEGPPKEDAPKWARERHDKSGIDGVYVVIAKKPGYFRVYISENTRKNLFKESDIDGLVKALSAKATHDKRLIGAAQFVLDTMNKASEPELKEK